MTILCNILCEFIEHAELAYCSVADSSTGELVINLLCNMFSSLHRTIQYTQSDFYHDNMNYHLYVTENSNVLIYIILNYFGKVMFLKYQQKSTAEESVHF